MAPPISWTVKPEDFSFHRPDGVVIQATPAVEVVDSLMAKASRGDVIHLVTAYEAAIYGNPHLKSTNGYEARRRNALAEVSSAKLKAAAAASAIALVSTPPLSRRLHRRSRLLPQQRQAPRRRQADRARGRRDFEFDADAMPGKVSDSLLQL